MKRSGWWAAKGPIDVPGRKKVVVGAVAALGWQLQRRPLLFDQVSNRVRRDVVYEWKDWRLQTSREAMSMVNMRKVWVM